MFTKLTTGLGSHYWGAGRSDTGNGTAPRDRRLSPGAGTLTCAPPPRLSHVSQPIAALSLAGRRAKLAHQEATARQAPRGDLRGAEE